MIRDFILCLLISIMISFAYLLLIQVDGRNKLKISYSVDTEIDSISQLYWKKYTDETVFHENRTVRAHPNRNHLEYLVDQSTSKITIVPVVTQSNFSLDHLKIHPPGSLIPAQFLTSRTLNISQAIDRQNFSDATHPGFDFQANTANPIFTFSVNRTQLRARILIVNTAIVFILLFLCTVITNKFAPTKGKHKLGFYNFSFVFALLPVLQVISVLSNYFNSPYSSSSFIAGYTIFIFLIYMAVILIQKNTIKIRYFLGLAVIPYIVLPDIAYKLKYIDRKTYTTIYTPVYHWRLPSAYSDNITSSGAALSQDIGKIKQVIKAHSSFISDPVTSYYLLSFLPLYSSVGKSHHGGRANELRSPFVSQAFLKFLCGPDPEYKNRNTKQYLEQKSKIHKEMNWPEIKYVILNKDRVNKAMGRQCLTAHNNLAVKKLEPVSDMIYKGKYLDVYEIRSGS